MHKIHCLKKELDFKDIKHLKFRVNSKIKYVRT